MKEREETYPFDEDLVLDDICIVLQIDSGAFKDYTMQAATEPLRAFARNWIRNAEQEARAKSERLAEALRSMVQTYAPGSAGVAKREGEGALHPAVRAARAALAEWDKD